MAGLNKYNLMTAVFIALTQTQLQNQGFGIFDNYWLHLLEETVKMSTRINIWLKQEFI